MQEPAFASMLRTVLPQSGPLLDLAQQGYVAISAILDVALVAALTHVLLGPGCQILRG